MFINSPRAFLGAQNLFCGAGVLSFAFLAFGESHKNTPSYVSGQVFTLVLSPGSTLSRSQMGLTASRHGGLVSEDLCVSLWL